MTGFASHWHRIKVLWPIFMVLPNGSCEVDKPPMRDAVDSDNSVGVRLVSEWSRQLELELDQAVPILGAHMLSGEDLLVWTSERLVLMGRRGQIEEMVAPGAGSITGVGVNPSGDIEVIRGTRWYRISTAGQILESRATGIPGLVEQAAYVGECGWFIGAQTGAEQEDIAFGNWMPNEPWEATLALGDNVRANAGNDGVVLHRTAPPFTIWFVDCDDPRAEQLVADGESVAVPSDIGKWFSVAIVPVRNGYIRTLADLISDERLLMFYDMRWKLQRQVSIDVSLAIVGSNADRTRVVGVANLGSSYVYSYAVEN